MAGGCTAALDEVRPPDNQFFFPTGVEISPDESVLFVTNANSELRYDSGTVSVMDIPAVRSLVDDWLATGVVPSTPDPDNTKNPACERDVNASHTLICNENQALIADATVRTGNFATELGVQTLADGNLRLFIAMRGDPSVTWIDYDRTARQLECGGSGAIPVCDDTHRITQMREDLELPTLVDEPFGIYVDSDNEYAMVTHLSSGAVSLIDTPADGTAPLLVDSLGGLFSAGNNSTPGAVGIAGRRPGADGNLLYVTSRTESRIQTVYVNRPTGDFPQIVPSDFFFLRNVVPSDDSRGIVFSSDGDRAYIVNRDPPMLLVVDTSLDEFGRPRNELDGAIEICPRASNVTLADVGRGERAYVSCFQDSQVWVVDTNSRTLDAIITVGRGPHSLRVSPTHKLLFVANFLEDTVAVVDLTPGSSSENRVALRLGRTRATGGK